MSGRLLRTTCSTCRRGAASHGGAAPKDRSGRRSRPMRVRVADGTPTRAGERSHQHLPGDEEVWLVGERRATGEQKYYLSNLPAVTTLKALAAAIKARWLCEQAHQQLKEELGLDHFEGRSWSGLHRHALMSMVAFLYLQHRRLQAANRGKKTSGPPPQPSLPAIRTAMIALFHPRRCRRCPFRSRPPIEQHKPNLPK